ncbi:hypothetical protein F5Y18DRAFT_376552 [Xylariaceae sp. FL1019]|nr:hypothetical protein F5Y18DRAFT_376552 [Xylariaceae sp. FL1019]
MCFYYQTKWSCEYWRWGSFAQRCPREYRIGETCSLKFIYDTYHEQDVCQLCKDKERKQRRLTAIAKRMNEFKDETASRVANIEALERQRYEVFGEIAVINAKHQERVNPRNN